MKSEQIFIFIILLVGLLILFLFLGGKTKESFAGTFSGKFEAKEHKTSEKNSNNYDNYNHFSGLTSSLTNGAIFYGPNGGLITVQTESDGKQTLNIKMTSSSSSVKFTSKPFTKKFFGPDDEIAYIIDHNHQNAIKVVSSKGTILFITSETQSNSKNKNSSKDYKKYNNTPNTYYGSTGDVYSPSAFVNDSYTLPNKSIGQNTSSLTSLNSTGIYNSSMPPGIPRSQIIPGQEDLYILKSEIVPPVCPSCPSYQAAITALTNAKQEQCPPCPACARCPEPSFECKKVPNYHAINNEFLPVPVLNDFSTFGM